MKLRRLFNARLALAALACGAVVGGLLSQSPRAEEEKAGDGEVVKYVGAKKCKMCHSKKSIGAQYKKWEEGKHSKAFNVLATEAARKVAKEKGIDDPQKAEECLKCHVTAYGKPVEMKSDKFDEALGVQCESCHGPGETHVKARKNKENKGKPVPEGEIVNSPAEEVCTGCHNEESPSFKDFNFEERLKEIAHPRPEKDGKKEEKKEDK